MRLMGLVFGTLLMVGAWAQGKIVVANDEWTLSNSGYSNAPDADRFAQNVANRFTGGRSGNFLAYTNSFGLTSTQLANTMRNAGHTWTVSTAGTLNLSRMQTYDAIFLGGYYANIVIADLIQYVQNGGNVYLMGGATSEAGFWNPFLNAFGLSFASFYNGIGGNLPINSPHLIFAGVSRLYQSNGNSIIDWQPANPNNEVLVFSRGQGLLPCISLSLRRCWRWALVWRALRGCVAVGDKADSAVRPRVLYQSPSQSSQKQQVMPPSLGFPLHAGGTLRRGFSFIRAFTNFGCAVGIKGVVFFSCSWDCGRDARVPSVACAGNANVSLAWRQNALLGSSASRHARRKTYPFNTNRQAKVHKKTAVDDPLLKVPPARRGNRVGAPDTVPLAKRGEPKGGGQL